MKYAFCTMNWEKTKQNYIFVFINVGKLRNIFMTIHRLVLKKQDWEHLEKKLLVNNK